MGLWNKLFGSRTVAAEPIRRTSAGATRRRISYDPTLVDGLKRDHRELVQLYAKIGRMFESGRFDDIRGELLFEPLDFVFNSH